LILFSFFYATSSFAEKLSLICHPFDYDTETQQNKPLKQGAVRYVGQTLAGFLDSDTYSLRVSTECKGKGAEKVCLNITDSHYCPKPSPSFKFRGLKDDDSIVMISDRCDGSWTKYQLIGRSSDESETLAYMEERTYFQLKNQIHSGINISKDKPVFLIGRVGDGQFESQLVSFRKELWEVNIYDPLRNKLKVSFESYENNLHESFSLISSCSDKK
jgi:hypothetical protein